MSEKDNQFDRRSVLKSLGSTAVAGIGLSATSGSAAAIETKNRLARAYSDERRLRTAFEQHGEGLRQTLVKEGFVAEDFEFGALDFDIDPTVNGLEPSAHDQVAGVSAIREDGTTTAFASVSTSSATHEISLFVQPERDKAYALVEPRDSDDRFRVTDTEVSPQGCLKTECQNDCCTDGRVRYVLSCDDDCTNCEIYDTDCECSC